MSYVGPVRDMLFNIRHLVPWDELVRQPHFLEVGSDIAEAVLYECAKFCEQVIARLNATGDRNPSTFDNGSVSLAAGFSGAYDQFVRAG